MKRPNFKYLRSQRRKEFNDFLNFISTYSISYQTAKFNEDLPENHWGYTIIGLSIPVEPTTLKHIRPQGITNAKLLVDIEIVSDLGEWNNINDPFISLNFKAIIKAINPNSESPHFLAFHIDRHNGHNETNEIHPLYHLQYLQNPTKKPDFNHGESLQLDIPRMMHFPMELILGTSFLISNFAPISYSKIIKERQYVNLCKEYQERIWKPYINSLESYWSLNPNQWFWNPKLNCPYLV